MNTIVKILLNSVAVYVVALVIEQVVVMDYVVALIVSLVLGIINVTIKPIVKLLTFPITFITLGLFTFVINGAALYLVSYIVPDFSIVNFWWAMIASILITFLTAIFETLILPPNND